MLHHPHHGQDQLLEVEGEQFDSYVGAYDYCQSVHPGAHPNDYYGDLPPPAEDEFEEDPQQEDEINDRDWAELAAELPQRGAETEDIDLLGNRDLDVTYDWSPCIGKYPNLLQAGKDF